MFMLLFQAAQQMSPEVYVNVQASSGGMPEWVKILISAATGSVFGIAGNVTMEVVKPKMARRRTRAIVLAQINEEFLQNMNAISAVNRMLQDVKNESDSEKATAMNFGQAILHQFATDRFKLYFEKEKDILYEIEGIQQLISFIGVMDLKISENMRDKKYAEAASTIAMTHKAGERYIEAQKLSYVPSENTIEELYAMLLKKRNG